jgi:phosphonate transport system ATP-binding protein
VSPASECFINREPSRRARLGLRTLALERVAQLDAEGRARLLIAREVSRGPHHLIVREVDAGLDGQEAGMLLATLRILAHSEHIAILASAASRTLARAHGHRVIGIADGLLVYDGPPPPSPTR